MAPPRALHERAYLKLSAALPLVLLLCSLGPCLAADNLRSRFKSVVIPDNPQEVLKQLGGVPEVNWDNITDPSEFFNQVGQATLSLERRKRMYADPANMLNPTCGIFGLAMMAGVACPAIRTLEAFFRDGPPQLHRFFQQQIHPSRHMNRILPVPLAVYNNSLPEIIDKSVGDAERRTYWWYFSGVNKVWEWMGKRMAESTPPPKFPDLLIAEGWKTGALMTGVLGPLAMAISRNDHLVILVRGSLIPEDWAANFNYTLLTREQTQKFGLMGRVHAGFGEYASQIGPQVDEEILRIKPKRITLAGDSLGAAVANLLGAYVAQKHGNTLDQKVEVVAIASPRVGDKEFSDFYRAHVNGRTPSFLGEGLRLREDGRTKLSFEIGDCVTQVPWSCYPLPECHFKTEEQYLYHYHGGMILVTPSMLPNPDGWEKEANWVSPSIGTNGIVASHMCSMWCYVTAGSEADGNMCYFPWQKDHKGSPYDMCAYGTDLPPPPPLDLDSLYDDQLLADQQGKTNNKEGAGSRRKW